MQAPRAFLSSLEQIGIKLGLDQIRALVAALDHPERTYRSIIIAGTNGKGSVTAMLERGLRAAGYRTGRYTSPHLVRLEERFSIDGVDVDPTTLDAALARVQSTSSALAAPPTFFEATTAAALDLFRNAAVDITLLEVGLGGRLDATNVVEHPAVCCITSISMDHMQFLGETIEAIAFEKAGILKAGVPTVFGPQPPPVAAVLARCAADSRAIVYRAGREWHFRQEGEALIYNGEPFPLPALPGRHQVENAAVALALLSLLERVLPDLDITAGAKRAGLRKAQWPARLQRLARGPLVAALPPGCELWLDGGHNEGAGQVLAQQLDDWAAQDGAPARTHLIYGMLNTKQAEAFLAPLAPRAASLQAVAIPGEANSFSAEEVAAKAPGAVARGSVMEAIRNLPQNARRVLICGSLYLAGRVLAENG